MINGISIVTTAATAAITNCLTALSKEILDSIIKLTHRSMQVLFRSSLDKLR